MLFKDVYWLYNTSRVTLRIYAASLIIVYTYTCELCAAFYVWCYKLHVPGCGL